MPAWTTTYLPVRHILHEQFLAQKSCTIATECIAISFRQQKRRKIDSTPCTLTSQFAPLGISQAEAPEPKCRNADRCENQHHTTRAARGQVPLVPDRRISSCWWQVPVIKLAFIGTFIIHQWLVLATWPLRHSSPHLGSKKYVLLVCDCHRCVSSITLNKMRIFYVLPSLMLERCV